MSRQIAKKLREARLLMDKTSVLLDIKEGKRYLSGKTEVDSLYLTINKNIKNKIKKRSKKYFSLIEQANDLFNEFVQGAERKKILYNLADIRRDDKSVRLKLNTIEKLDKHRKNLSYDEIINILIIKYDKGKKA